MILGWAPDVLTFGLVRCAFVLRPYAAKASCYPPPGATRANYARKHKCNSKQRDLTCSAQQAHIRSLFSRQCRCAIIDDGPRRWWGQRRR